MTTRIPFWIRALLSLDRAPRPLARLADAMREEALLAWVPQSRRDNLTVALFDRQLTYAPGGNTFACGLFDWERELVALPIVPRKGRILLGGAGGGRETVALRDLGYEVTAFEPAGELVRAGGKAVVGRPGATLLQASYDDMVRGASGEASSLSSVLRGNHYDIVMLGWGSLSHVMRDVDRLAILRAARAIAPDAPLLLSFDEPTVLEKPGSIPDRTRRVMRWLFHWLRAPGHARHGDRFVSWAGYFRESSAAEIEALALSAGYQVAFIATNPGRAVLKAGTRNQEPGTRKQTMDSAQ